MAMDEIFKAQFDDSEIMAGLNRIEKQLVETGQAADNAGKEITQAFDIAGKEVADFSGALQKSNQQVAENAKQVESARQANQTWLQSIKQTIAGQQIGGKTLAEWGEQARGFAARIREGAGAIQGATIAQRIFNGVLAASGIGLLASAIGAAIAYLTRFQSGMDKVSQATAAFGAVVNASLTRLVSFGSAIAKVFSGDFSGAANDARAAIAGIGAELVSAATAAIALEQRVQALRDATITSSVEIARQQAQLESLKAVVDDDTQSIAKRINLQRQAAAIETDIAKKRLDEALEAQQIEAARFALSTKTAADRQAFADAEIKLTEAQRDLNEAIYNGEQKARELRKQAAEENAKAAEKRRKALEDERKLLEQLAKDLQKLRVEALGEGLDADLLQVNQKFDELAKVAADGVKKLNEIEARRGLTPEELAQRAEFAELSKQLEEQRLSSLLDVLTEYNEKEIQAEEEQRKRKEALAQKDLGRAIKAAEAEKKLRDEQINLGEVQAERFIAGLRDQGASEKEIEETQAEFERQVQTARLKNELDFQQTLLSLTDKGNTEQIKQIESTIATIQQKIGNLQIEPPSGRKPGKGIWGLLGLTDEEGQGINEAASQIIGALNEIADARIEAAQRAIEAIDQQISAQENAVDREAELAKEGVANDLAAEKAKLADLKKQRDAALREEAKARRAQIALDTVGQLSSLITASANIFKSLSSIPFAGVPLAIGLIAAMFGAFVTAKAKALKAAEAPKFRKGGRLPGRSHEHGGTPLVDSDGVVFAEAERGEYLLPVGPSREHEKFLDRVRANEFQGVDLNAVLPRRDRNKDIPGEAATRVRDVEQRKADVSDARQWAALKDAYREGSERIVSAIEGKAEIMPWKNGYKRRTKKGNTTNVEIVLPTD